MQRNKLLITVQECIPYVLTESDEWESVEPHILGDLWQRWFKGVQDSPWLKINTPDIRIDVMPGAWLYTVEGIVDTYLD